MTTLSLASSLQESLGAASENAACRMLVEKWLPGVATANGPIDVAAVAVDHAGLEMRYAPLDHIDGMLSRDDDGTPFVLLSSKAIPARRRFTIAHELAHWLMQQEILGPTWLPSYRGLSERKAEVQEEERLANRIAAELLLPYAAIARTINGRSIDFSVIRQLTRRYEVSQMAAIRRVADVIEAPLVYLGIIPRRFSELGSPADIDEAVYFSPADGVLTDRATSAIIPEMAFEVLRQMQSLHLRIDGPRGCLAGKCDAVFSSEPIPNISVIISDIRSS